MKIKTMVNGCNLFSMISYYRYVSLGMISLFYLLDSGHFSILHRLLIVGMMMFSAMIMNYLYKENRESPKRIRLLILIEVIQNSVLLIPTGGMQSPYVWYMLNTILLAGIELGIVYAVLNMLLYLVTMSLAGYLVLNVIPYEQQLQTSNFNVVMGFVITACMAQILIRSMTNLEEKGKELKEANEILAESNQRAEACLDELMRIYQTMHLFSAETSKKELIHLILAYLEKNLKIESALFIKNEEDTHPVYTYGMNEVLQHSIRKAVLQDYVDHELEYQGKQYVIDGQTYVSMPIHYTYISFGVLIIKGEKQNKEIDFLIQLSAMLFKKIQLEKINNQFLISEEQNRIANEIHDGVLQELFGISCNLFETSRHFNHLSEGELKKRFQQNIEYINQAMKELRSVIYGLSWNKQGKNNLLDKVHKYIEEIQVTYHAKIVLLCQGEWMALDSKQQKGIYRIICESISNGVRHGKATEIKVSLAVAEEGVQLRIQDNGKGFNQTTLNKEEAGIGLKNMQSITRGLRGRYELISEIGEGTLVKVRLPLIMEGGTRDEVTHY